MRYHEIAALTLVLAATPACTTDQMTGIEALQALEEVNQSSRGEQATAEVIEVSTDFTIGDALEAAAEQIAAWWESQADCTEITVEGATATVDFGGLEDACVFNGHTYAGVTEVTVEATGTGALEVRHDWYGFTNGDITVNGGADVTWDGNDATRRVVTEHTWTDNDDGDTVDVTGDHVTAPLEDGVSVWDSGFTLDGTRDWTHDGDLWTLEAADLELRMIDPAPQAGTITVTNPAGKTLEIRYERVDDYTIQATLVGLVGGDRVYHITALGLVEEVEA